MNELQCDGKCEEHKGTIKKVKVIDENNPRTWEFNYCDIAIEDDEKAGFIVEIIEK